MRSYSLQVRTISRNKRSWKRHKEPKFEVKVFLKSLILCDLPLLYSWALNQESSILICLLQHHHRKSWSGLAGGGVPCLLVHSHSPPGLCFQSCLSIFHGCSQMPCAVWPHIVRSSNFPKQQFLFSSGGKRNCKPNYFFSIPLCNLTVISYSLKMQRIQMSHKEAPALIVWEDRCHQGTGWQICFEIISFSPSINN